MLSVTHKALSWLLCVRLERAWVAASLSTKLSLLSNCTTAGMPPETHINPTSHSHFIVVSVWTLRRWCECARLYPGLWSCLCCLGGGSWRIQLGRQLFSRWCPPQTEVRQEPSPHSAHGAMCDSQLRVCANTMKQRPKNTQNNHYTQMTSKRMVEK